MLVVPIDKEAPKGRILQVQAQTIRDLLDGEAVCIAVQDGGLARVLDNLKNPPKIVVTDAQAFQKVARVTPDSVPLTAFSILMSRLKGDLVAQAKAALTLGSLRPGDRVLVAESCTHHPIEEDIGRVKIPRWLRQCVGGDLNFTHVKGRDFPKDLSDGYARIVPEMCILCGNCILACPSSAKQVRDDLSAANALLASGRNVVVSLAPSFVAQFPGLRPQQLVGALKQLGFSRFQKRRWARSRCLRMCSN